MKNAIAAVSLQRVYMRYEMFRAPISEIEITNTIAAHRDRPGVAALC
jgi:hypothetical protein